MTEPARLLLFVEDDLITRLAMDLADRVMAERAERWLQDLWEDRAQRDRLRAWCGILEKHGRRTSRSDLKAVDVRVNEIDVDARDGRVLMALKAAKLAAVRQHELAPTPVALVIGLDADKSHDLYNEVRRHLDRFAASRVARTGSKSRPLAVALAIPYPESEAWVVAGFVPENRAERDRLDGVKKRLPFDPVEDSHELSSTIGRQQRADKERDAKTICLELLGEVPERDNGRGERCWLTRDLDELERRGTRNGLRDYLADVLRELVPVVRGR